MTIDGVPLDQKSFFPGDQPDTNPAQECCDLIYNSIKKATTTLEVDNILSNNSKHISVLPANLAGSIEKIARVTKDTILGI